MDTLAIHLDSPLITLSRCQKRRGKVQTFETEVFFLPEEGVVSSVKRLDNKKFRGKVISGLCAKDFLVRQVDLKVKGRHAEKTLAFQSEALSHFKTDEILIETFLQPSGRALLFTVPKDGLKAHLEKLGRLNFDPDIVSTAPSALCRFICWKFPKLSNAFIVDLGSHTTTCSVIQDRELKKIYAIQNGIEELFEAFYEDQKGGLSVEESKRQIDFSSLKADSNPRLLEKMTDLKRELARVHRSFDLSGKEPVIFTGRLDTCIHLEEILFDSTQEKLSLSSREQLFAVSMGLCLESTQKSINLRKEEFFPRKNWSRMGLIALLLLGASIFLSLGLIWGGAKTSQLKKEELLNSLPVPFENWIEEIEKNDREYPYILQTPKVAEILSWLSSYSILDALKNEGDPIEIREFRTQLVSYPSIEFNTDDYLTQVELEFSFKNGMSARRFHEALRNEETLIDPEMEITWEVLDDAYRTSFYLKNKRAYVP